MIFAMTVHMGTDRQSTWAISKPMVIEIPLPYDPRHRHAYTTQLHCTSIRR